MRTSPLQQDKHQGVDAPVTIHHKVDRLVRGNRSILGCRGQQQFKVNTTVHKQPEVWFPHQKSGGQGKFLSWVFAIVAIVPRETEFVPISFSCFVYWGSRTW